MRLTIILSTYNAPVWLEKVLWGYSVQTHRDFEIVVADDGSTLETARTIRSLMRRTGLRIQHVWHEDLGFRKCEILNKAIVQATGDYLVFSDGDCIPRSDFVATHAALADRGCFLSGGVVRLPMSLSGRITIEDVIKGRATSPGWLIGHGWPLGKKGLLMMPHGRVSRLLDVLTTTKPTWNGHNASGWKADIVAANGFDQRLGYGGEDRELGERLVNAGIRPIQIRHQAICVHLDHSRSYVDRAIWNGNRAIRRETQRLKHARTPFGIEGPLSHPGTAVTHRSASGAGANRKAA